MSMKLKCLVLTKLEITSNVTSAWISKCSPLHCDHSMLCLDSIFWCFCAVLELFLLLNVIQIFCSLPHACLAQQFNICFVCWLNPYYSGDFAQTNTFRSLSPYKCKSNSGIHSYITCYHSFHLISPDQTSTLAISLQFTVIYLVESFFYINLEHQLKRFPK